MHLLKKGFAFLWVGVGAAACSRPAVETIDSLMANPTHLKEVLERCKENRRPVDEGTCVNAGIAAGRRLGTGNVPYTPAPVQFDAKPAAPDPGSTSPKR